MIKLPAKLCGGKQDKLSCLSASAQQQLEDDLGTMVSKQRLVPGKDHITKRPGSYMVVVREFETSTGKYQRQFYCENWTSPSKKFQLVFWADKAGQESQFPGVCYLDEG